MEWYKADASLGDHPKLDRLAELLEISDVQAMGHLHLFWGGVARVAEAGQITKWSPRKMARFARWDGDPQLFFEALIVSGFVDNHDLPNDILELEVHDWYVRHKAIFEGRERQRIYRETGEWPKGPIKPQES